MDAKARAGSSATVVIAVAVLILAMVAMATAQDTKQATPVAAAVNHFIGAEKCKNCHQAESGGSQYTVWQGTAHAKAYDRLASDEAKASGKKLGIDEPQKSDKCLKCHTTAFGVAPEIIKKGFEPKNGVQCESCHGPGETHMKARFAAAAAAGGDDKAATPAARQTIPDGEIITKIDQKTCLVCHNDESPNFKPFCFHEKFAKMKHYDPRKTRVEGEELVCGCAKCECVHGCEPGKCGVPAKDKK